MSGVAITLLETYPTETKVEKTAAFEAYFTVFILRKNNPEVPPVFRGIRLSPTKGILNSTVKGQQELVQQKR